MPTVHRRFHFLQVPRGLVLSLLLLLGQASGSRAASCEAGLAFGANAGTAAMAGLTISGLSATSPIRLRTSLGYSSRNPGRAEEARRVFINEATGGTPEKHGSLWSFGLDLLLPLKAGPGHPLDL
jgi:hypothetical protein